MKTKLYFFISLLFLFFFLSSVVGVYANEITTCGDDFSTAIELKEGKNTGGLINEGSICYYYINSKSGYEIDVRYKITGESFFGSVSLYNSEKTEIVASIDGEDTLKWLGADTGATKYYLVVENDYQIDTQLYDVALVDRTDGMSQTDAGNDFDNSVDIKTGEYTGSLSSFTSGAIGGNDDSDYYKLPVKRGDTIEIKVTPKGDFKAGCAVYDSNRSELFNEDGLDLEAGQIIQESFVIQSDGYLYIVVKQPFYGENWDSIDQYTLLISNQNIDEMGGEVAVEDDTENDGEERTDVANTNTKDLIIKLSYIALGILVVVLIVLLIVRITKKNNKQVKKETSPKSKENTPSEIKEVKKEDKSSNKVKVTVEEGTDVEINTVETEKKEKDEDKDKSNT